MLSASQLRFAVGRSADPRRQEQQFSVTEGEDKPLKYPSIFNSADVAVVTKCDLASVVAFDRETALASVRAIQPTMSIVEVSTKTSNGMAAWLDWIEQRFLAWRQSTAAPRRPC